MNFLKRLFGFKDKKRDKYIKKSHEPKIAHNVDYRTSSNLIECCYFCNKKDKESRKYVDEKLGEISVCAMCVEYAERRAFSKVK